MYTKENHLSIKQQNRIICFDLEWTKNYRVKDGNRPFCYSFVYFDSSINPFEFEDYSKIGFYSQYIENVNEINALIKNADSVLNNLLQKDSIVVGHQLSSDISIIIKYNRYVQVKNFIRLNKAWSGRNLKRETNNVKVFDTRYDLKQCLSGKSYRLVDVCSEYNMDVTQSEIRNSMTKMQNEFYTTGNALLMEKLAVLNLRHALSSGLLYYFYLKDCKPQKKLYVNKILYRILGNYFGYVRNGVFEDFYKNQL